MRYIFIYAYACYLKIGAKVQLFFELTIGFHVKTHKIYNFNTSTQEKDRKGMTMSEECHVSGSQVRPQKMEVRELYFFEQFPFSMPLSSPLRQAQGKLSASCESSIHVKARSSFSPVRSLPNLPCIHDAIKAFQKLSNNLSTIFVRV